MTDFQDSRRITFREFLALTAELTKLSQSETTELQKEFCGKIEHTDTTPPACLDDFSESSKDALRDVFALPLYRRVARTMARLHHYMIPSEMTSCWLRVSDQILCPTNSQFFAVQEISHGSWLLPLCGNGLTALAFSERRTLRLSGNEILRHPAKRFPYRLNVFLRDNISHSLLRTPVFTRDAPPLPLAVLSAENKLAPATAAALLGPNEQRIVALERIAETVASPGVSLPEKFAAVDKLTMVLDVVRFSPEDVINSDGPSSTTGEIYTEDEAKLANKLSVLAQALIIEIHRLMPGGLPI